MHGLILTIVKSENLSERQANDNSQIHSYMIELQTTSITSYMLLAYANVIGPFSFICHILLCNVDISY